MKKNKFYAIYKILKNDEMIVSTFDHSNEVVKYLNNKVDTKHLNTYIKNNYIIEVNQVKYKVYQFNED